MEIKKAEPMLRKSWKLRMILRVEIIKVERFRDIAPSVLVHDIKNLRSYDEIYDDDLEFFIFQV